MLCSFSYLVAFQNREFSTESLYIVQTVEALFVLAKSLPFAVNPSCVQIRMSKAQCIPYLRN